MSAPRLRRLALALALAAPLAVPLATPALTASDMTGSDLTARERRVQHSVAQRVELMLGAKEIMAVLANMVAGRVPYDAKAAREARRQLIRMTRSIPKHFRKPHRNRLSNARPLVWQSWVNFNAKAEQAEVAAKMLKTQSRAALGRPLPHMVNACLGCHRTYRDTVNEFITH
jgi:cytochrome c556